MTRTNRWLMAGAVVLCLLSRLVHGSSAEGGRPEVNFLPGKLGTEPIVELLRHARKSVDIAAYTITSEGLASVLLESKIPVRVVLDEDQAYRNKFSVHWVLFKSGRIQIRVMSREAGVMANDFGVIDGTTVYTGSSFLHTSLKELPKFGNYLIFRDDAFVADRYQEQFNWLFERAVRAKG